MVTKYTAVDIVLNDPDDKITDDDRKEVEAQVRTELASWDNFTRQEFLKITSAQLLPYATIHDPFARRGLVSFGHSLRYPKATFITRLGEFYGEILERQIKEER